MKILRRLQVFWLEFVLGQVPIGLPMQCDDRACGKVVHRLTVAQYNRWRSRRPVPCRACSDGQLADAAVF